MKVKMYSAKIETVNKALDLLRSRQSSRAAKNYKKMTSKIDKQATLHCSSSKMHNSRYRKKKKVASSGFSRGLIAIEMRKCLMRHDLAHVAELLSLLLEGRIETEPLVWRYLVTELLYSSKSSSITLNHFLEMCVGSQSSNFFNDILTVSSPAQAIICEEELL